MSLAQLSSGGSPARGRSPAGGGRGSRLFTGNSGPGCGGEGEVLGRGRAAGEGQGYFCSRRPGSPRRGGWRGRERGCRLFRRFLARAVPGGQAASWAPGAALPGSAPGGAERGGGRRRRRQCHRRERPVRSRSCRPLGRGDSLSQGHRSAGRSAKRSGPPPARALPQSSHGLPPSPRSLSGRCGGRLKPDPAELREFRPSRPVWVNLSLGPAAARAPRPPGAPLWGPRAAGAATPGGRRPARAWRCRRPPPGGAERPAAPR